MIDAVELTKDYGTVVAVRHVTFHVGRGEVVGFLGLNGAGKTTTLRMLAGSLGPTSGRVVINGYDLERAPLEARRSLGYMPEATPLYPEMRVGEYLAFRGRLKGHRGAALRRAVAEAAERARVADMERTLIGHLSKGYRQRVGLADALLGRPPLLILDEPTAGLDPLMEVVFQECVREVQGRGASVLLSSHILAQVEVLADRISIIRNGTIVESGSLGELRHLTRTTVVAEVASPSEDLTALQGVHHLELADGQVRFEVDGDRVEEAMRRLAAMGIRSIVAHPPTLEQLLLRHYSDDRAPAEGARQR